MAKPKSYVLRKPIEAIFPREDGSDAVFHAEDVGLEYPVSDQAVARAVELYPDHFTAA